MTAAGGVDEPARRTELYGDYDVVVVGGGPAGIAAAVGAARHGAHTLLVERYGFLGGMGTAGGVTNFAGLYGCRGGRMQPLVRGVADELLHRIAALGGLNEPQDGLQGRIRVRSYDVAAYKCAADQLLVGGRRRVALPRLGRRRFQGRRRPHRRRAGGDQVGPPCRARARIRRRLGRRRRRPLCRRAV